MKYVLFYEAAPGIREKAPLHFAAHMARWQEFRTRGTLLMIGPFAIPEEGALAIFATREAALEFAAGDPFVLEGIVSKWYVRDWNEALA
ncbi:MAG: YciI family protein [Vulcanimicrobiaceae bacterium]